MKGIEKIIYNELASMRSVVLPMVGTLSVARNGMGETGKKKKGESRSNILFRKFEPKDSKTIVDLVEALGLSRRAAEEAYFAWLEQAKTKDGLVISGVGELHGKEFKPTQELDRIINPINYKFMNKKKEEKKQCSSTCKFLLVLLALVVLAGSFLLFRNCSNDKNKKRPVKTTQSVSSTVKQDVSKTEVKAETTTPAKQEEVVKAKPVVKRYHVIVGVFRYETNADNMVKYYESRYPEIKCERLPFKGMTMVSIFSSDNIHEAYNKSESYAIREDNYEIWVHDNKW